MLRNVGFITDQKASMRQSQSLGWDLDHGLYRGQMFCRSWLMTSNVCVEKLCYHKHQPRRRHVLSQVHHQWTLPKSKFMKAVQHPNASRSPAGDSQTRPSSQFTSRWRRYVWPLKVHDIVQHSIWRWPGVWYHYLIHAFNSCSMYQAIWVKRQSVSCTEQ